MPASGAPEAEEERAAGGARRAGAAPLPTMGFDGGEESVAVAVAAAAAAAFSSERACPRKKARAAFRAEEASSLLVMDGFAVRFSSEGGE